MPRTRSTSEKGKEMEDLKKYMDLLAITQQQQQQQGEVEEEKEKEEEEVIQQNVIVRIRGSTKLFVEALEPLGPDRRKWLQDTPFHKLLDINTNIQNNGLIRKLVTMFNTEDNSIDLEGEKHVITTQHVTDILGIEDGEDQKEIKIPGKGYRILAPPKRKRDFTNDKGICMDKVRNILRESFDEDDVKRAYMLLALRFIVSTPASHDHLAASILDLVEDVSTLNNKRWATFVITSIVKGIETYKNSKGNIEMPIGGCPLLLQLYATKGSITTPLKCDKRGKKSRGKDCSDSSNATGGLSIERAKELFREDEESLMAYIEKRRERNLIKYRKNSAEQSFLEDCCSNLKNTLEERSTNFYKYMDERVEGVARH